MKMKQTANHNKRFITLKSHHGIRKDLVANSYVATKSIKGKRYSQSFERLPDAIHWKNTFVPVISTVTAESKIANTNASKAIFPPQSPHTSTSNELNGTNKSYTLGDVWELYKKQYLPQLERATTETKLIWCKFFEPLFHVPMVHLNSNVLDVHMVEQVELAKINESKRHNFKNPLSEMKALLNWYHENYDARFVNPILRRHYTMGIMRKVEPKNKKMLPNEIMQFFSELSPFFRDFATIQFYSASRVHEIAGLQTFNINLVDRWFLIKHVVVWDKSKRFLELKPYPKNGIARYCHMNPILEEIIRIKLADVPTGCNYLFHIEGKPLCYRKIQYEYDKALKKCGLGDKYSGTHIMRHSMATLTRRVTGSLDATQAVTGHRDQKLVQHYADLPSETQANAVVSVEQFMVKYQERENEKRNSSAAKAANQSADQIVDIDVYAR
ncbi:MAG: site-specific integrase [Oligoflexia bacterium]|nr:site-specific integrase [Oligoflexia bacterium]